MKNFIPFVLALHCLLYFCGCSFCSTAAHTSIPNSESSLSATDQVAASPAIPTAPDASTSSVPAASDPAKDHTPDVTAPSQQIIQPEPSDDDFVMVKDHIPNIFIELPYSTENNFTGQEIYAFSDAWLRYGTVKKLIPVQEELSKRGIYLKIWDGFRPPSAQFKLWSICPDPTYVSDPTKGFSSHSRGNTVDVTLVYADGTELDMPTGFDDFSRLADRDYSDCEKNAAANAMLLEETMKKHGFKPYSGEWWHFSDTQPYPADEAFEPVEGSVYRADCSEYISLRSKPLTTSSVITKILTGEQFLVVAKYGDFARIKYNGLWGYVLLKYIEPLQ